MKREDDSNFKICIKRNLNFKKVIKTKTKASRRVALMVEISLKNTGRNIKED